MTSVRRRVASVLAIVLIALNVVLPASASARTVVRYEYPYTWGWDHTCDGQGDCWHFAIYFWDVPSYANVGGGQFMGKDGSVSKYYVSWPYPNWYAAVWEEDDNSDPWWWWWNWW